MPTTSSTRTVEPTIWGPGGTWSTGPSWAIAISADRTSRQYPSVDSPDQALNRAAAWAIRRLGGHLPIDPASAIESAVWDEAETEALLEDARRWERVRNGDVLDAGEFLGRLVGGLLGVRLDGLGGRLEIRPSLPPGWRQIVVRRLRAHRNLLDLEIRPRAEWLTVKLAVRFGPPLAVAISSPVESVARVTVDDIPLVGPRAIFTAEAEHEVVLLYGEERGGEIGNRE